MPPHLTLESLEDNLKVAYYGVIKESKDMNPNCRGFALPSLCFSVLPICRTPEKTNHQYFRNIALQKEKERLRKLELAAAALATTTVASTTTTKASTTTTTTTSLPLSSKTVATLIPDTTTITSTKHTTQGTKSTDLESQFTITQEKIFNLTDFPTTVKPRPKKSQKSRDRKSKKHSHQRENGDSNVAHSLPSRDMGQYNDFDDKSRRNRRFLGDFWDEHLNFGNMAEKFRHLRQAIPISHSMIYSPDSNYPPARSTSNLRRICRNECELLENELCQKEYAIAKRHPAIGQVLPIEDCSNLPDELNDCSSLGIAIEVDENEDCYWENGSKYRGTAAVSKSGKPCLTWARLMKEIADYPELAGTNYCR